MSKKKTYICAMRDNGDIGIPFTEYNVTNWGRKEWYKFTLFMKRMTRQRKSFPQVGALSGAE